MNTLKIYFIILLLISCLLPGLNVNAQENSKKLTSKQKKELQLKKKLEEKQKIISLLETKKWIVEFDMKYDLNRQNKQLNPLKHFTGVNGETGIYRDDNISSTVIEGKVSDFKIIEGKGKRQPMVKYHFIGKNKGDLLKTDILITVNSDHRCNVVFRYDMGDQVQYRGRLVPWEQSRVSKKGF